MGGIMKLRSKRMDLKKTALGSFCMIVLLAFFVIGGVTKPTYAAGPTIVDENGTSYSTIAAAIAANPSRLTLSGDFTGSQIDIKNTSPLEITLNDATFSPQVWIENAADLTIKGNATFNEYVRLAGSGDKTFGDGSGSLIFGNAPYGHMGIAGGTVTVNSDVKIDSGTVPALTIIGNANATINGGEYKSKYQAIQVRGPATAALKGVTAVSETSTGVELMYGAHITEITDCNITGYTHGVWVTDQNSSGEITTTKVDLISNSDIKSTYPDTDGMYAKGAIYVQNRLGNEYGFAVVEKIKDCTLECNATYNYSGGIVVTATDKNNRWINPPETWDHVRVGEITGTTIVAKNGSAGIVCQNGTIGNITECNITATDRAGKSIYTNLGKVGNITKSKLTSPLTSTGAGVYNGSGIIGNITETDIVGNAEGIHNEGYSATPDTGSIGNIFKTAIEAQNCGIKNYNEYSKVGNIDESEIKAINESATGSSSSGIYNSTKAKIGSVTNTKIKTTMHGIYNMGNTDGIDNCNIYSKKGIGIYSYGGDGCEFNYIKNSTIKSDGTNSGIGISIGACSKGVISGNEIDAPLVALFNQGNLDEVKNNKLVSKGANGIGISNGANVATSPRSAGKIKLIDGNTIEAETNAIFNGKVATTETISDNNCTSKGDCIWVFASNLGNGTIGEIASGTYESTEGNAVIFTVRSDYKNAPEITKISGGTFTGAENGVKIDTGIVGTITGDPVFWGKNGYAIDNTDESAKIKIEPTLSKEPKGNARYLGQSGQIAKPDLDEYPTYLPKNVKYKMSTRTEAVSGIADAAFHYLTIEFTVVYDPNGGNFDGNTNNIEEKYEGGTQIAIHNAPKRDGYKFLYWKGSEYNPGDNYTVTDDHTFVAQWEKVSAADDSGDSDDSGDLGTTDGDDSTDDTVTTRRVVKTGDGTYIVIWLLAVAISVSLLVKLRARR